MPPPSTEEMKPCPNPWCDSQTEDVETLEGGFFRVGCMCGVKGPANTSEAAAIKLWNTRTPPTLNSLKAKVERAATRGNVGPDLGAMSYAERDEVLFGISTLEGPPDDVLMAVRALLDKHIERCRVAMNECENWAASTPSEWERARDELLSFGDDLEALVRTSKAVAPDDVLVERLRELRMQRAEIFDCGDDDVDVALGDAIEALARITQPKGGADGDA